MHEIDCLKVIQMDINFLSNEFIKELQRENTRLSNTYHQLNLISGIDTLRQQLSEQETLSLEQEGQLAQ